MRRLADGVERRIVATEISAQHRKFIESRDMFWLATIDHQGRPTVSYKGGDPGFVRVLDQTTIAFPCYDGNGMLYSMGNLMGNNKSGCRSSILNNLIGCVFRELRRSATMTLCWQISSKLR